MLTGRSPGQPWLRWSSTAKTVGDLISFLVRMMHDIGGRRSLHILAVCRRDHVHHGFQHTTASLLGMSCNKGRKEICLQQTKTYLFWQMNRARGCTAKLLHHAIQRSSYTLNELTNMQICCAVTPAVDFYKMSRDKLSWTHITNRPPSIAQHPVEPSPDVCQQGCNTVIDCTHPS